MVASEKYMTAGVLLCGVIFIVYYAFTQDLLLYNDGIPYDCFFYAEITKQMATGQAPATHAPFVWRMGLPFLVSLTYPDEIILGFRNWNLLFGCVNLFLLYLLMMQFTRSHLKVSFVLLLFIWQPLSPFRVIHLLPVNVYPPAYTAILLILYYGVIHPVLRWKDSLLLSAVCFVGVFFKEIVIVPAIAIFCQQVVFAWRNRKEFAAEDLKGVWLAAVPVFSGFVAFALTNTLVDVVGGYSMANTTFIAHAKFVLVRNLKNPDIPILSAATVFGFILSIPLARPVKSFQFMRGNPLITFYIIGFGILSVSGGIATPRILFLAHPGIFALILYVWGDRTEISPSRWDALFCLLIIVGTILTFRVFSPIPNADYDFLNNPYPEPDYYLLAPYGAQINPANLSPAFMGDGSRLILLAQILASLALVTIVYRKSISGTAAPNAATQTQRSPVSAHDRKSARSTVRRRAPSRRITFRSRRSASSHPRRAFRRTYR